MEDLLLQVKDLKTYFYTDDGVVKAVESGIVGSGFTTSQNVKRKQKTKM